MIFCLVLQNAKNAPLLRTIAKNVSKVSIECKVFLVYVNLDIMTSKVHQRIVSNVALTAVNGNRIIFLLYNILLN